MKALIKKSPEKGIWLEDVPIPEVDTNDVLIRIQKTAICGTDLHIYQWNEWAERTIKTPLVTGHEFSGVVQAIGPGVTHYKKGDRVSGEGHITCGNCRNCLASGLTIVAKILSLFRKLPFKETKPRQSAQRKVA